MSGRVLNIRYFLLGLLGLWSFVGIGQYTGTGVFEKITSQAELTDGYYLILNASENFAMNSSRPGNFYGNTLVIPSSLSLTNPSEDIVWKIELDGSGRTIQSADTSLYPCRINQSGNNLNECANVSGNNQRWNISENGAGDFTFFNLALTDEEIRYNPSNPRFSCYTTGFGDGIVLYKLQAPTGPTIILSETSLSGLSYEDGTSGPSAEQTFTVSGTDLTADITLTAPTNFEISTTSGSGFGNTITLTQSGGTVNSQTIYVRLAGGLSLNNYSGTLTAASTGATPQEIDLSGSVFIPIFEDFNDGNFTADPVWTGDTSSFSVITDATIPDGNATTDGSFLASIASEGDVSLAVQSTENKEWRFSLGTPDFDPSSQNYFGVVLMSSNSFSGDLFNSNFQGYYISIGIDNPDPDVIELWRKDGSTSETWIGDFSTPDFGNGALRDGLDIRITRNNSGEFELFYSTGFEYAIEPTTSAGTLTDNTYSTSNYFGVFQNINSQANTRRVYIDNIELGNPNIDDDTTVLLPASGQIASSTIQADAVTLVSNSVPVLNFNVSDSGTSDGEATQITQLRFVPGASNTAIWSEVIQGIRIERATFGIPLGQGNQTLNISDSEILIDIIGSQTVMTVADGVSEEYTISVFLNTSNITDQQEIQFEIESVTTGWDALFSGSQFQDSFINVVGNTHTIDVVGSNYEFITQPVTSLVNQPMGLNVEVAYIDVNGNIDTSFSGTVDLTSTGTLSAAIPSQSAVNGVVTFPATDIVHTALGNSLVLEATSATSGFPNPLTSNTFDIISTPELFITEIVDPFVVSGTPPGRYVELYNAGVNEIDFSSQSYHLVRDSNGGGSFHHVTLVGVIGPKEYYTIGKSANFNTTYGFDSNHNDDDDIATVSGNGNDAYFISTDDTNDTTLESTIIDLYGEVGPPSNLATWNYEDSRAYRDNPTVKNANAIFDVNQWTIESANLGNPLPNAGNMTPGYGDNDYIYDNGNWNTNIYLQSDPDGVSQPGRNIFIKSGTVSFSNDTEIGDLVVRSGATLKLEPGVKLTVHGDIVNQGTIIFESDDNSTAVLEAVQPNTRVVGNGFEIHRRIPVQPGFRAFRYLSSSVTTPAVAQGGSVFDNWQQSGLNPEDSGYQSGFGTHITGTNVGEGLGFDPTPSGNPSMFAWNNSTQVWASIPNTNATGFEIGDAYAILIRGDRSSPLDTNDQTGSPTTLRTTGRIRTGDFSVPNLSNTIGHFNLLGNPYQSQVDLVDLLKNNSQDVDDNYAYVWDPRIGTLGGNVTINLNTLGTTAIPLGETVPVTSDANQYLQPQQAFFVETIGTNPQITFRESTKNNATGQTEVFSSDTDTPAQLDITLKSAQGRTYDGLRIVYDNAYANAIDQYDAVKLWNYTDNLAVLSQQNYLSIEKRSIPTVDEVTSIYLGGHSMGAYTFDIQFSAQAEFSAYLVDHYTEESIALPMGSIFSYEFNVDANIPSTLAQDRFEISYDISNLSSEDFNTSQFVVYPNPLSSNQHLNILTQAPNSEIIKNIEVLNLNGQILEAFRSSEIDFSDNLIELNFESKLSSGTYLLKIKTDQKVSILKFIMK